jgi:plasmid stabilization system protein ParE
MTFKVIIEDEAKREWNEAVDWYDNREPGVGYQLNEKIHAVLQTLSQQPERFPLATRLTRRVKVLGPWPYSAYFTIDTEYREVKVLAIWHGKRNPAELRRRLK